MSCVYSRKNPELSNYVTAKQTVCDLDSTNNIYSPTQEALIPKMEALPGDHCADCAGCREFQGLRIERLSPDTTGLAMVM